jgi:putative toxin-antitoxin system antitoxin component (TIGR02293 family)
LPPHAAETLLRLVEIHDMAEDVFATETAASTWLRTPHPLLDNEVPLDMVRTSYGAQLVKNLLMSTKYGGAA